MLTSGHPELEQYPYVRRSAYIEPFFTPLDMFNDELRFTAAVTDAGACQVCTLKEINNSTKKLPRVV